MNWRRAMGDEQADLRAEESRVFRATKTTEKTAMKCSLCSTHIGPGRNPGGALYVGCWDDEHNPEGWTPIDWRLCNVESEDFNGIRSPSNVDVLQDRRKRCDGHAQSRDRRTFRKKNCRVGEAGRQMVSFWRYAEPSSGIDGRGRPYTASG